MWSMKGFGKCQDCGIVLPIALDPSTDDQAFQDWIFLFDGHDKLLQIRNRHLKAGMTDAITLLESGDCFLFIFCSDVTIFDIEWEGRRICQHVCNGRTFCTDEGKTQVG
jgi:hypothetical protein